MASLLGCCEATLASASYFSLRAPLLSKVGLWFPEQRRLLPSIFPSQMHRSRRKLVFGYTSSSTNQNLPLLQQQRKQEEEEDVLINEIAEELYYHGACIDEGGEDILFKALMLVDLVERLGIQRHFKLPLRQILQCIYMRWDEKNGLDRADNTVLAFQSLRLHGYPVSASVLENLKDEDGSYSSFMINTPEQIPGALKLFRCSQVGFPSESNIMRPLNEFARSDLQRILKEEDPNFLQSKNQSIEIKFALENTRECLMPRLESRSIVRQLWPGDSTLRKYLELAKLDMDMLQKLYQKEMDELESWWKEHNFSRVPGARKSIQKCYFSVAPAMYEPQYSAVRVAFAKGAVITIILDDIFDNLNNLNQLRQFTEAMKRWDHTLVDDLPELKIAFSGICNTITEMAKEASRLQGYDVFPFLKDMWANYLDVFLKEAEWNQNKEVPTFTDYIKVGVASMGQNEIVLPAIFFSGEQITREILEYLGPDSRFQHLVGFVGRLANDLVGFEKESREGKLATAVGCYMRDNPECSREEAVMSIRGMIESALQELEWEMYRSSTVVPKCCSLALLSFARCTLLIYKRMDGFTDKDDEYLKLMNDFFWGTL